MIKQYGTIHLQSIYYYTNRETGELLTWKEMLAQARESYDWGDDTNCVPLDEYYEQTECRI